MKNIKKFINNGLNRYYHGKVRTEFDDNGNLIIFGDIIINNGYILAKGNTQKELNNKLDELILIILNETLNKIDTITAINSKFKFPNKHIFLN